MQEYFGKNSSLSRGITPIDCHGTLEVGETLSSLFQLAVYILRHDKHLSNLARNRINRHTPFLHHKPAVNPYQVDRFRVIFTKTSIDFIKNKFGDL